MPLFVQISSFLSVFLIFCSLLPAAVFSVDNPSVKSGAANRPALHWNTFMGSAIADDVVYSMAVDGAGSIYGAGTSGISWGSPLNDHTGSGVTEYDAFIVKLNNNGTRQWHTYFGSRPAQDVAKAISLDGSGNIYVTGTSQAGWGSPLRDHSGNNDVFVAKFDSNGALLWNTFLGAVTEDDVGKTIALDRDGNIYIAGTSIGGWGLPLNAWSGDRDGFAAKLSSDGVLLWHTFIGSSSTDFASAIATDISGNVYIGGTSAYSWGAPVSNHSSDVTGNVGYDAFVLKLNNDGGRVWHTFMGALYDLDFGSTIAVSGNKIYLAGSSYIEWGDPVHVISAPSSSRDIFVARLGVDGTLLWNTFWGSVYSDDDPAITADGTGNVYLAGSSIFGWGDPVTALAGDRDAFAFSLSSSGDLRWNTFIGSGGTDYGYAVAAGTTGDIYIGGMSYDRWGTPVNEYKGSFDGFIVKFNTGKSQGTGGGSNSQNAPILTPMLQLLLLD
jgi:hypothetical protein